MPGRILVVDDEVHLARILQFTLEHGGYEVSTAFDGEEAVDLIKKENPDLVILDLMLPRLDGYKVCNMIKKDERLKDTPVIVISARDLSNERIDESIEADLFVEKPFNTGKLLGDVARLLENSGKIKQR